MSLCSTYVIALATTVTKWASSNSACFFPLHSSLLYPTTFTSMAFSNSSLLTNSMTSLLGFTMEARSLHLLIIFLSSTYEMLMILSSVLFD